MFVRANKAIRAGAGFVADYFRKPISDVMSAGSWAAMRNANRAQKVMTGGMYAGIGIGAGMVAGGAAIGSASSRNPGMGAAAGAGAGIAGAAAAYPLWAKYMKRSLRAIR